MSHVFQVASIGGAVEARSVEIEQLVIAGWAGRDRAAVEEHIRELEEIGVAPPSSTPVFYRTAADGLTQAGGLQMLGPDTSGEIETVLIASGEDILVAVGSDHTDRKLESHSIAASKQVCAKPVSVEAWRLADVEDHWDELVLRAYATIDGERVLYQEGPVSGLLHPRELFEKYAGSGRLAAGTAMFGGTLAVHGGIRPGTAFECELHDPRLGRSITHSYAIETLPVVS